MMYLVVLLALVGASSAKNLPGMCLPGDQFLVADETECNKFFYCSNGFRIDMICPAGLLFDQQAQDCIEPEKAACTLSTMIPDARTTESPKTTSQSAQTTTKPLKTWSGPAQTTTESICGPDTSFEPHPESPNKYYICYNGRVFSIEDCDEGMVFDRKLKECNHW